MILLATQGWSQEKLENSKRPGKFSTYDTIECARTAAKCARCCYGPIYKYQCLEDIGLFCWRHLLPYLSN